MTTEELKIKLFELDVPHYFYSIGEEKDRYTCLVEEGGKWIVFYCEDGERHDVEEYYSESDACDDLLKRVSG